MKHLLSLLLFCIAAHLYAQQPVQQMSYADWLAEAKTDSRLLPEYGGTHRTPEHRQEDEAYIKTTLEELHADRHNGSEQMVELGFNYYGNGDFRVAMHRFNQAWLLDSLNPSVYAGFGAIYLHFGDFDTAKRYYDKGLALNPANTNLLTDMATVYMAEAAHHPDTALTGKAFRMLTYSYTLEPKQPSTSYMLSRYYILQNNCDSAVKYYNICKNENGPMITDKYTNALKKRCNSVDAR